jgi:hypothetical protein
MINPLIEAIFEIIVTKQVWRVHTLASELAKQEKIPVLDQQSEKNLFKRNFLIMNALYQLQSELKPDYLHVAPMHIELYSKESLSGNIKQSLSLNDALREYYLAWENYDTSTDEINELLTNFWRRITKRPPALDTKQLKEIRESWYLNSTFSYKELQKRWRELAIKAHPDKSGGSTEKFKQLKIEYEQLKLNCSKI